MSRKLEPVSPREMLAEDFLKPLSVSNYRLAKELGVTKPALQHSPEPRRKLPYPPCWSSPMSTLLDELSKKAQTLTVEERAQLAQELLESVERDADPDVQAAWEVAIADRIAKYERGEAKLIPAEEVFASARRLTQ
ncbi:MAG: addiction module protein [Burkholderiaceae bacterium]|nr:addiction module protein [Burkholderiaceae bacterium]